ncbi:MAG: hypothetical protein H6752_09800 [Candidatus Omnitrophica bacterium]|nr:hypothetical protein [Candidatus Omnitrophota bacterium]
MTLTRLMHRPNRKQSTLILAMGVSAAVLYFNASMAINEIGFVRSGFPGDAYLPQEPAIKRVVEQIPNADPVGYLTNPDEQAYLISKLVDPPRDGIVEKGLKLEHLFAMERFFNTQYYMAPHKLEIALPTGEEKYAIANFTGELAESPPDRVDSLSLVENLGNGISFYERFEP